MGFPGYRGSIRASLAYVGMAAATASALVVLQSSLAVAVSAPDAITVGPASGTAFTVLEGNSALRKLVGTFTDTGRPAGGDCNTEGYVATINWGDGSSIDGAVSCEVNDAGAASGTFDVIGSHTWTDSGSYNITVSVVDNSESAESSGAAVKTDAATVTDASLFWDNDNSDNNGGYVSVEGKSVTVAVDFFDANNAFPNEGAARDPGTSGTIDWGDGSALQTVKATAPQAFCECSRDFEITASHVYDAAIPGGATQHITVTGIDDGGSTATATFTADIADGALTAGGNLSLGATATQAFNSVVGTFTDEAGAQAAAADFAATINWGDNSSSTGTVTKTGTGAFGVSGMHAYASAGSKSITATVTDQEGNTVTLKATAAVVAAPVAPVVLPATGQPTQPTAPLILLALLIVGLVSLVAGGRILAKMPR
jgi:hypothetical protein